jgi:ribosomal protein S18 acetylase RimI-like enzyme
MQSVEKAALEKGFLQMRLTVHPTNINAVAFYERCGWLKTKDESGIWTGSMIKPIFKNIETA